MALESVACFQGGGGDSPCGWTVIKQFLLVRVSDREGRTGWAEAYVLGGREPAVAALVEALADAYRGQPASPRAFREFALKSFGSMHGGIDFYAAVSALEIALWDLTGKRLDAPLHRLLGGALRQIIPLYANLWSNKAPPLEAIVERCREHVAAGFRALKLYPLTLSGLDEGEALLAKVREAVGPQVRLMVDLYCLDDPQEALRVARRLQPYDLFWFEEPVTSDDLDSLAEIRRASGLRIVSGERHGGKLAFREILARRAADALNPDVCGAGGILEFLEIAAMAEAHSVQITPHCYNSMTLGLATMLQLSALVPNFLLAEYFPAAQPVSDAFARLDSRIENGSATLPQTPGLGVTPDETQLRALG